MNSSSPNLVASATAVLLDFDGPLTRLMPWPINAAAADTARAVLLSSGVHLPASLTSTTDHLEVLRYSAALDLSALEKVEAACTAAEVAAAQSSAPTPGAIEFLAVCHEAEKPVVIVSNNAADAVHAYLNRFRLHAQVHGVVGRHPNRPDLLKPHPSLIGAAVNLTGLPGEGFIMVGDSATDVEAANHFNIPTIGFARNDAKAQALDAAGARLVVRDMWALVAPARQR